MAKKKRATRQSGLVDRAVSAGRRALREAQSRVPPDLRRQLERSLGDADKTARAAIKTLQTQVSRASSRADVNSVLKRIDALTRQARQIAQSATARPATTRRAAPRRASTGTKASAAASRRKPLTRKAAARKPAARKPAAAKPAARTTSPRRRATTRRSAAASPPEMVMAQEPVEVIEVIEVEEA